MTQEQQSQLDEILERCLNAIETHGVSIEECLVHFPDQRAELLPLLTTAVQLRTAQAIRPSQAFRQQAQARLMARIALAKRPVRASRPAPKRQPVWMGIGMAGAFAGLAIVMFAFFLLMSQPQATESTPQNTPDYVETSPDNGSSGGSETTLQQGDPQGDEIDALLAEFDDLNASADGFNDQP